MLRIASSLVILLVCCIHAQAVHFEWASVGNPGNAGELTGGIWGYEREVGNVDYSYRISKTEVTNAQYAEFLNAVDPTGSDPLDLYPDGIPSRTDWRVGIQNSGTSDGARYVVESGREYQPITEITWFSAIRFINWMNNGQGNGDTEDGAYTLLGNRPIPLNALTISRNLDARIWMPNEDEWYKAAYHDASAGTEGKFFDFATGSNSNPYSDNPTSLDTPDNSNVANYVNDDGLPNGFNDGHAVFIPTEGDISRDLFTDVGAYEGTTSAYGTFDQNGNAIEWNETIVRGVGIGPTFGARGGSAAAGTVALDKHRRVYIDLSYRSGFYEIGFRVASSVPTPASLFLLASTSAGLVMRRVRRV